MSYGRNSYLLTELSTGDLLKVNLGMFSHWGVYVGGQNVIHLVGLPNDPFASTSRDELFSISGKTFSKAEVRMDNFWTFVGSHQNRAEISNSLDTLEMPLPEDDIVRRAKNSIGKIGLSPRTKNCENFAKWCRYGDYNNAQGQHAVVSRYAPARERMASDASERTETNENWAGAVAGIAGLAVGAFALYKLFSGSENKKTEDDDKDSGEDEPCSFMATSSTPRNPRGQKEDRYFGRFRCNNCHHQWESANVYTVSGTKKVKDGQKCIRCNEEFIKPYHLQLILCSVCNVSPCFCRCEDCGKLKNKPATRNMPSSGYGSLDEHYCLCTKRRNKDLGEGINPSKHHPSDYCQRCQRGHYCTRHPWGL